MPPSSPSVQPPLSKKQWLIVGVLAVVAVAVFSATWFMPQKTAAPVAIHPKTVVALTPESYRSLVGIIESVAAPTVVVQHTVVHSPSSRVIRHITVTVGTNTTIRGVTLANNQEVRHPIQLTDLKVGDKVMVGSDTNIATLNAFTATLLQRIDY